MSRPIYNLIFILWLTSQCNCFQNSKLLKKSSSIRSGVCIPKNARLSFCKLIEDRDTLSISETVGEDAAAFSLVRSLFCG